MTISEQDLNDLVEVLTQYIDQEIQKKSKLIYKVLLKKINLKNVDENNITFKDKLKKKILNQSSFEKISEKIPVPENRMNAFEDVDIKKYVNEGTDIVEELIHTDYRDMLKKLK